MQWATFSITTDRSIIRNLYSTCWGVNLHFSKAISQCIRDECCFTPAIHQTRDDFCQQLRIVTDPYWVFIFFSFSARVRPAHRRLNLYTLALLLLCRPPCLIKHSATRTPRCVRHARHVVRVGMQQVEFGLCCARLHHRRPNCMWSSSKPSLKDKNGRSNGKGKPMGLRWPNDSFCWLFGDVTNMGQPKLRIGNHHKVITGEKYWTHVPVFPQKFPLSAQKAQFLSYHFCLVRQWLWQGLTRDSLLSISVCKCSFPVAVYVSNSI